jgi:hypothetical protein
MTSSRDLCWLIVTTMVVCFGGSGKELELLQFVLRLGGYRFQRA